MFGNPNALTIRQLGNLVFGLIALAVASVFPIRYLRRLATPLILGTIFVLFVLLLVSAGTGPRRSFLAGSVQPSELAKLAVIIYLAVWMESKGERLSEWGYGFLPLMTIIGIVGGLILLQPDLSAVLTVAMRGAGHVLPGRCPPLPIGRRDWGSAIVGYILVRLTNTGRARWADYMAGLVNIQEASYHVQQSLQSFFSGGLLGRGLGASREKFGLLPAPHTDSIYAVIGEELGLIGALLVLTLFALLLWRSFRIAIAVAGPAGDAAGRRHRLLDRGRGPDQHVGPARAAAVRRQRPSVLQLRRLEPGDDADGGRVAAEHIAAATRCPDGRRDMFRLLVSAGGTGGGVYPALAITAALGQRADVLWLGSDGGMEAGSGSARRDPL